MWKFKKEFAKNTIAFKGRLISAASLTDKIAVQIMHDAPSLAVNFEKVDDEKAAPKIEAPKTSKGKAGGPSKIDK